MLDGKCWEPQENERFKPTRREARWFIYERRFECAKWETMFKEWFNSYEEAEFMASALNPFNVYGIGKFTFDIDDRTTNHGG